jgi:hypothetical protein
MRQTSIEYCSRPRFATLWAVRSLAPFVSGRDCKSLHCRDVEGPLPFDSSVDPVCCEVLELRIRLLASAASSAVVSGTL